MVKREAEMKKNGQDKNTREKKMRWQSVAIASTGVVTMLAFVAMEGPKIPLFLGE